MFMDFARKALSVPALYDGYQSLVGSPRAHQRIISEMVKPAPGERLLDIGCGVGAIVPFLPDGVRYVGIDMSAAYIEKARKAHGGRGEFLCTDISSIDMAKLGSFDRAVAFGVLHHISDAVAAEVVDLVRRVVRPGGSFFTIDPCYAPGQNPIAKLLIDNDRGEFVRDADGYRRLLGGLGDVQYELHHDLLRIPYTQIVTRVALEPRRAAA